MKHVRFFQVMNLAVGMWPCDMWLCLLGFDVPYLTPGMNGISTHGLECTAICGVGARHHQGQIHLVAITVMAPLSTLVLPLPPHAPPSGYGWSDRPLSTLSTTTAFHTGLDQRDQFLGECRCVICGNYGSGILEHCHVIMDSEPHTVSQNGI